MRRPWLPHEDEVMRQFYPRLTGADMAQVLKRSERSVYSHAKELGLHKSEEFLAGDRSGRVQRGKQDPRMRLNHFKPGLVPWNKGTKGVVGVQEACRATQFKPGRPPSESRNYKPVGSLRMSADGYLERKVTDDHPVPARRWVAVHRLVWEAERGPIPHGHVVRFKRGLATTDPALITADRLECITRLENMRRNSVHAMPPELARLSQLKGALNRQIHRREREQEEAANG
jgi:hypothetical protein